MSVKRIHSNLQDTVQNASTRVITNLDNRVTGDHTRLGIVEQQITGILDKMSNTRTNWEAWNCRHEEEERKFELRLQQLQEENSMFVQRIHALEELVRTTLPTTFQEEILKINNEHTDFAQRVKVWAKELEKPLYSLEVLSQPVRYSITPNESTLLFSKIFEWYGWMNIQMCLEIPTLSMDGYKIAARALPENIRIKAYQENNVKAYQEIRYLETDYTITEPYLETHTFRIYVSVKSKIVFFFTPIRPKQTSKSTLQADFSFCMEKSIPL